MKMKNIAVIYTILMLLVSIGSYYIFTADTNSERDMVAYYEQMTLITKNLEQGADIGSLETEYRCHILLLTDDDYETLFNERIKSGDVIFDLHLDGAYIGKVTWDAERVAYQEWRRLLLRNYLVFCVILLAVGYLVMAMIYFSFVRPFRKLQTFTNEIAKGNLDLPLPMEQNNFFGAFTESFDIMREELKKAKESEYQANRSKKELVAELSHDIKTPIATIRAACEVIQMKESNSDTLEKINVINGKAEMIDQLISNLFHATMEELEVLKVEVTEESSLCIKSMFEELKFYGKIRFENEIPECLLYMDKLRLHQVIDNIVNNSYKYASTAITVSFQETEAGILVQIKDSGPGVPEEELVLVTEKYYRGHNAEGIAGSGLGLYLVSIFLNRMHGALECYNDMGFTVVIFLKKVSFEDLRNS